MTLAQGPAPVRPGVTPQDVMLPGWEGRLRQVTPVQGPADVPAWMTRGGGAARVAATALDAGAVMVRRVGDTLRGVLGDVGAALGWRGDAATAAQGRAAALQGHLAAVASQYDAAGSALGVLAGALDEHVGLLGSAATLWARPVTGPGSPSPLAAGWEPAVRAVDAADARCAAALGEVATALRRVHVSVAAPDPGGSRPAAGSDPLGTAVDAVGSFCAAAVDALASFAHAMGSHPQDTAALLAGLVLVQGGSAGELAGLALDTTGVGAVAGVPAGALSAAAIAGGTALAAGAAGRLGQAAAGQDHVTLMSASKGPGAGPAAGGGGAPEPRVDIQNATYAQRTFSDRFSDQGFFKGCRVADVAADLRAGRLTPEDVPVNVIVRRGRTLILNTRSAQALEQGGVPRSAWRTVDQTGDRVFERRLNNQLDYNGLDEDGTPTVGIRRGR